MTAGVPAARRRAGVRLIVLGLVSILLGWLASLTLVGEVSVYVGLALVIIGGLVVGRVKVLLLGLLGAIGGQYLLMLVVGPVLYWTLEELGMRDDEGRIVIEP